VYMPQFVEAFYDPIVDRHGSIREKTDDRASMARGRSGGVAVLLAPG